MFKRLLILAMFLCGTARVADAAAPRRAWRTVVTPHFRIHFHEGLTAAAERLAPIAEDTLSTLERFLGQMPESPIHVVMTDETDSANGFAQVLPQNVINLFPAVPEAFGSLGDFDDSLRVLFVHELTHVVHLDTIGGIPRLLNSVLGKTLSPNQVQPRWFIEGLAVYAESRFSARGRNRNALIDMFLREDVLAGRFLSIDELTSLTRRFPGGGAQWSYGGRFLQSIAERHGEQSLAEISAEYGSRLVPYGLNIVAGQVTGESFVSLWEEWRSTETVKARAVEARVLAEGLRIGRSLERPAEEVYHPRFSRNGLLAVVEAPRRGDTELVFLAPDRRTEIRRMRTSGGHGAFTADGQRFVSTVFDTWERQFAFMDLEIIDVGSGVRRRRTHGARLDEPDVSSQGRIVAVHQSSGESALVTLSLDGHDPPASVYVPPPGHQVSSPSWSPDGQHIVAALHRPEGGRHLVLIDAHTGAFEPLTVSEANDFDPIWDASGDSVVFASDRGGVYNLYEVDLRTRDVSRLSNVLTGAFEPTLAPDGRSIVFVHGVFGGYTLNEIDRAAPLSGPKLVDPPRGRVETSTPTLSRAPIENYSPFESLLPWAWLPTMGSDGLGSTYGVFVGGSDVVGAHTYELRVEYGTQSKRLNYVASYTNRQLWSPIFINSSLIHTSRPGSFVSDDGGTRPESIFRVRAGIDLPLGRWDASTGISLSYGVELRRGIRLYSFDPFQRGPSPGDADTTLGSLGFSFRFSNVRAFADSISPARGHGLGIGVEIHDPRLGSDYRLLGVTLSLSSYLTLPWASHHVLASRISLGAATGDSRGRSVYVLGGLGVRNILTDAVDEIRVGAEVIRGYPIASIRGNAYFLEMLEYRLPVLTFSRGLDSLPAFVDRLYAAAFVDLGDAPTNGIDLSEVRFGAGGELRLDVLLGYYMPFTARLGLARGVTQGGVTSGYLVLGGLF